MALIVSHPDQLTIPQKRTLKKAIRDEKEYGFFRPYGLEHHSARKLVEYGFLTFEEDQDWRHHVTDAGFEIAAKVIP